MTVKIPSPHPEFVLTGVICIEKAFKRTEIVFVLAEFRISRVCTNEVLLYLSPNKTNAITIRNKFA